MAAKLPSNSSAFTAGPIWTPGCAPGPTFQVLASATNFSVNASSTDRSTITRLVAVHA